MKWTVVKSFRFKQIRFQQTRIFSACINSNNKNVTVSIRINFNFQWNFAQLKLILIIELQLNPFWFEMNKIAMIEFSTIEMGASKEYFVYMMIHYVPVDFTWV